jgi:hypothetical protein
MGKMKSKTGFRLAIALFVVFGLVLASTALFVDTVNAAEPQTFQGVLEEGEKGPLVLKTDDGQSFNILGMNLREMVGKTVKVTGTVSKGKSTRAIVVSSFEEVPN